MTKRNGQNTRGKKVVRDIRRLGRKDSVPAFFRVKILVEQLNGDEDKENGCKGNPENRPAEGPAGAEGNRLTQKKGEHPGEEKKTIPDHPYQVERIQLFHEMRHYTKDANRGRLDVSPVIRFGEQLRVVNNLKGVFTWLR